MSRRASRIAWVTRYLAQVECPRYCASAVYPGDEARETAKLWTRRWGVREIDDVRALVERVCCGCAYFIDAEGERS